MNPLVILQARSGSKRLPGKVLLPLKGKPVIEHVVEQVEKSGIPYVIAIPKGDRLGEYLLKRKLRFFEGSENDVLLRYYLCAHGYKADPIGRLTSDCWCVPESIIMYMMALAMSQKIDFMSNRWKPYSWPEGMDFEVMSFKCLKWLHEIAKEDKYREHTTNFIYSNFDEFQKTGMTHLKIDSKVNMSHYKLSIDEQKDLDQAEQLIFQRK